MHVNKIPTFVLRSLLEGWNVLKLGINSVVKSNTIIDCNAINSLPPTSPMNQYVFLFYSSHKGFFLKKKRGEIEPVYQQK